MKITVLTLFPKMFEALNESLIGKAKENGAFELEVKDIRDFSLDKHKKVDDYPFGGGDGMVIMPQPLYDSISSVKKENSHLIYLSPKGTPLKQNKVKQLSNYEHLILLCGHYEGIDERIIDLCVDEQISVGDFVLTGGEIPAMALIDSVLRYVPNVLGNAHSTEEESFSDSLLEYPQYTRPREFMGLKVPDVLMNGNHKEIEKWRNEQKLLETKKYRPDLLKGIKNTKKLNSKDKHYLLLNLSNLHCTELSKQRIAKNLNIEEKDVVKFCRNIILNKQTNLYYEGKNLYCELDNVKVAINKTTLTIITAHK